MKKRPCTLFEMFFLNSWPIFTCQAKTEFYATKMTTVPSYLQCTKLLKVTAYVLHVICFNGKEIFFLKKENGTFFSPSITLLNLFKFWTSLCLIYSLITCLSWKTFKLYLYTNYYKLVLLVRLSYNTAHKTKFSFLTKKTLRVFFGLYVQNNAIKNNWRQKKNSKLFTSPWKKCR